MRNVKIAYILAFLFHGWFWTGIWIFFYLTLTSYAGIGVIEACMIIGSILSEIPSGALADLLGKKKVLLLVFALMIISNLIMGFAPNAIILGIAAVIGAIGHAFYSGTMDALVYDSLQEEKNASAFEKTATHLNTIKMLAVASSAFTGGFLYTVSHHLPFIITAVFSLLGLCIALFLTEPVIDSVKFSWNNYVRQLRLGFSSLFSSPLLKRLTYMMLGIGLFIVIMYEALDDIIMVEYGIQPAHLGILITVTFLISALASHLLPKLRHYLSAPTIIAGGGLIVALTLFFSPFIGIITGVVFFILRSIYVNYFNVLSSTLINEHTESKYRATTLSTFTMIKEIPYVILAFFLGYVMDLYSGLVFAKWLGLVMGIVIILFVVNFYGKKNLV